MKERLNESQLQSILSLLLHWYCIGILTMNYQINYMDNALQHRCYMFMQRQVFYLI